MLVYAIAIAMAVVMLKETSAKVCISVRLYFIVGCFLFMIGGPDCC